MSSSRSIHLPPAAPRRRHRAAVLLATVLVLFGASALSAPAAMAAPQAGSGVAWLRAAHLVPGIGSTRIDLVPADGTSGGKPVVMSPGATYGDVTAYQKIDPGTYTVTVRPSTGEASTSPLLSRRFTIARGQAMTLAVIGTKQLPRLATLRDDLTPPPAGQVNVRVLPAASSAQQLTVAAVAGPVIVEGAVLGQATAYKAVPAGKWTLRVSADAVPATNQQVDLRAGGVYTVVALDGAAGSVTTKVVTDAAGVAVSATDAKGKAIAAPQGGAQTGGGGTALVDASSAGSPWSGSLAAGLAMVALVGAVVGRRRTALVRALARR